MKLSQESWCWAKFWKRRVSKSNKRRGIFMEERKFIMETKFIKYIKKMNLFPRFQISGGLPWICTGKHQWLK
jgi:hypothetical protein